MLCHACWRELSWNLRYCEICAEPFRSEFETTCFECSEGRPWQKLRSIFCYQGRVRDLILSYKYGDRLDLTPLFVELSRQFFGELIEACDIIVPVPIHPKRLRARRYNQSAEFGRSLANAASKRFVAHALRKSTAESIGHGAVDERYKQAYDSFFIDKRFRHLIEGNRILLVDDVATSCATVRASCTRLIDAGSHEINIIVLARTPRHPEDDFDRAPVS